MPGLPVTFVEHNNHSGGCYYASLCDLDAPDVLVSQDSLTSSKTDSCQQSDCALNSGEAALNGSKTGLLAAVRLCLWTAVRL